MASFPAAHDAAIPSGANADLTSAGLLMPFGGPGGLQAKVLLLAPAGGSVDGAGLAGPGHRGDFRR